MKHLLDTNACIRYLHDPHSRVRQELAIRPPAEIRLSAVVMSELYRGALRSKKPVEERIKIDDFASPFTTLPFDAAAADIHASIRVDLERPNLAIVDWEVP